MTDPVDDAVNQFNADVERGIAQPQPEAQGKTDREAFEAWYLPGGLPSELLRSIGHPEKYNDNVVDAMWDAWQAATLAAKGTK